MDAASSIINVIFGLDDLKLYACAPRGPMCTQTILHGIEDYYKSPGHHASSDTHAATMPETS